MNAGSGASTDVDVLVIGMGPVGRLAALALGRAGHRVLVLDRQLDDYPLPRAVAHDDEIARILQSFDLPVTAFPESTFSYNGTYFWVNAAGEHLEEIDWSGMGPSGWESVHFYHQPSLEKRLDAALADQPTVTVQRGARGQIIANTTAHAEVTVVDEANQTSQVVTARYVIAADGARSGVRTDLGIGWHDLGFEFDWLVVDVVPGPHAQVTDRAIQVCDPIRPTTMVPGGPGRRRWEFMLLDGEDPAQIAAPDNVRELLAPHGVTPENSLIERAVVYTFRAGWAEQWRDNRVLLAGDAAHLMPPFAGQGLANGFRDVANLWWKLDLVLRERADSSILDTYQSERRDNVAQWIDFSMALGRIICVTDPEQAAARDREMTRALTERVEPNRVPTPSLGAGLHRGPYGGHVSRQGFISVDGQDEPVRFDDVFGAGALIVRGELAPQDRERLNDALRPLEIAVVSFDPQGGGGDFVDHAGFYATWLDELGARGVLVRPDLAIYGTGGSIDALAQLADSYAESIRSSVAVDGNRI